MNKKPVLHGLKSDFTFDRNTCNILKINPIFSSLPAVNWSDINQLVSSYVEKNESDIVDAGKAFSQICNSLETICKKRRKHLALLSYCTDLLSFLKQNKNKKQFKTRFASKLREIERQVLDTQARQEGYNNGIRLAIIGGRGYANTLDKEISTERREERYETDSVDSERETGPVKTQQEAVEPLLHCDKDTNIPDTETNFLLKVVCCHFRLLSQPMFYFLERT